MVFESFLKKMFKHILGQSVYQFFVLLVLIFYGENFLPEYEDSFDEQLKRDMKPLTMKYNFVGENCKFSEGNLLGFFNNKDYVRSGRYRDVMDPDIDEFQYIEKVSFLS